MKKRIVITGMGMLSSLANNVADTWAGILKGQSGVAPITHFDVSEFRSQISGSVKNFDALKYFDVKEARRLGLFIQYGLAAAQEAMDDSGLTFNEQEAERVGVAVGAGVCGLPEMEQSKEVILKRGPRKLSPFFIPAIITNMAGGNISIRFNAKGPNASIVSACATGTHNIGLAARMIDYGDADVMICGGTEMATSPLGLSGFAALHALSTRNDDPTKASRPWDKDRDGFVLGDGAGVLVIEELEHAKRRGAKIYAEIIGFGMTGDAYHITSPDEQGRGAIRCMKMALNDAGINPDAIDYINAHGTSTPAGDIIEAQGVKKVFGDHAYKLAMSSTKSMTGHTLGAAGAMEAIFCALAIRDQVAPPTINLDNPQEGCEDLNLVAHTAQERKIEYVLSNSFGFGGTNASVVLKKFED